MVLFLHTQPDKMTATPRPIEAEVAKNREGALAQFGLVFVPETATIREERR